MCLSRTGKRWISVPVSKWSVYDRFPKYGHIISWFKALFHMSSKLLDIHTYIYVVSKPHSILSRVL